MSKKIIDSFTGREISLDSFRRLLWTSSKRPTNEQIEDYYFQDSDDDGYQKRPGFRSPEEEFWLATELYHAEETTEDIGGGATWECGVCGAVVGSVIQHGNKLLCRFCLRKAESERKGRG